MAPPLGEADRTHISFLAELEPIVDRRAPQRRACGHDSELGALLLARYHTSCFPVLARKIIAHFARAHEARDELASEKHVVWGNRAQNIRVENVDEALCAVLYIPANEIVARFQIEHRIAERDDADELCVALVPDEIAEAPAIAARHGHRPG